MLIRAINKHGRINFTKEILEVFDTEEKMNLAERILVVIDLEVSYNLCQGGKGGWSYINRNGLSPFKDPERQREFSPFGKQDFIDTHRESFRKGARTRLERHGKPEAFTFKNRNHTIETKIHLSESHKGKHDGYKNSQYGTMWITDGTTNKKISKSSDIPLGFRKGRNI